MIKMAMVFRACLPCLCCFIAGAAWANVSVTKTFSDHMVLQRDQPFPIWGKAAAGEKVSVTLGNRSQSATTAANGQWKVQFDPMPAQGPLTLVMKGNNTVTVTDVYLGDVWQVAGQSNMDTRLGFYPDLADSVRKANDPLLRYFTTRQPGQTIGGQNPWLSVSPTTAGELSATGYFFGKEIRRASGVAVGLVVTAVGGTTITQWMDPATLAGNPSITNADKGGMWDTWVTPVAGYGIKGTVWIQGEQNCNATDAPLYGDRFALLIQGWRKAWGQGDFPFYFGQLSSTSGTPAPDELSHVAQVREGQRMGLRQPQTAMTVNFDIGAGDWHYPNKPEAGRRLSLVARALSYGEKSLPYSGPMLLSKSIAGNQVKLRFAHAEGGLVAKGGKLAGFAIASAAGNWMWGDAVIRGDSVIVSHPSIPNPTKVRYAWSNRPEASLLNQAGLPASPFTTESPELTVRIEALERNISPRKGAIPAHWPADVLGRTYKPTRKGRSAHR